MSDNQEWAWQPGPLPAPIPDDTDSRVPGVSVPVEHRGAIRMALRLAADDELNYSDDLAGPKRYQAYKDALAWLDAQPTQGQEVPDTQEIFDDYLAWIAEQPWPDGATHVTMDKDGGTCWWAGEPGFAPQSSDLGWRGALIERYYDPAQTLPCSGWPFSLRAQHPTQGQEADGE